MVLHLYLKLNNEILVLFQSEYLSLSQIVHRTIQPITGRWSKI